MPTAKTKTTNSKSTNSKSASSGATLPEVDQLKPYPKSGEVIAHEGLTLIEVADAADLTSIMLNKKLKEYILARLSDVEAIVLPQHSQNLLKALRKAGYTPKVQ